MLGHVPRTLRKEGSKPSTNRIRTSHSHRHFHLLLDFPRRSLAGQSCVPGCTCPSLSLPRLCNNLGSERQQFNIKRGMTSSIRDWSCSREYDRGGSFLPQSGLLGQHDSWDETLQAISYPKVVALHTLSVHTWRPRRDAGRDPLAVISSPGKGRQPTGTGGPYP